MQYSYECWPQKPFKRSDSHLDLPATVSSTAVLEPPDAKGLFTAQQTSGEALEQLERSLPFSLEEGLQAYQQYGSEPQAGLWVASPSAEEAHWDDFAKLVADHVLAAVIEQPIAQELEALKQQHAEVDRENRLLSQQIRELALENSTLKVALHQAELELAQYIPVAGGFFKKGS